MSEEGRIPNFLEAGNRTLLTGELLKLNRREKVGKGRMICVERGIFALRTILLFKALVLR